MTRARLATAAARESAKRCAPPSGRPGSPGLDNSAEEPEPEPEARKGAAQSSGPGLAMRAAARPRGGQRRQ